MTLTPWECVFFFKVFQSVSIYWKHWICLTLVVINWHAASSEIRSSLPVQVWGAVPNETPLGPRRWWEEGARFCLVATVGTSAGRWLWVCEKNMYTHFVHSLGIYVCTATTSYPKHCRSCENSQLRMRGKMSTLDFYFCCSYTSLLDEECFRGIKKKSVRSYLSLTLNCFYTFQLLKICRNGIAPVR